MNSVPVRVKVLRENARLPVYMTQGAAGCDVYATIDEKITLMPSERRAIPTGIAVEVPKGYEIQVRPRSGLAIKQGLTVINTPGTIDSDYRGEIQVLVINHGQEAVTIASGDRIAQLVLHQVERMVWTEVENLRTSARAEAGFGSTGKSYSDNPKMT